LKRDKIVKMDGKSEKEFVMLHEGGRLTLNGDGTGVSGKFKPNWGRLGGKRFVPRVFNGK